MASTARAAGAAVIDSARAPVAQHLWGQAKQLAIRILKLLCWRPQLFKAANEFGSSDKSSIRFLIQAAKVIR